MKPGSAISKMLGFEQKVDPLERSVSSCVNYLASIIVKKFQTQSESQTNAKFLLSHSVHTWGTFGIILLGLLHCHNSLEHKIYNHHNNNYHHLLSTYYKPSTVLRTLHAFSYFSQNITIGAAYYPHFIVGEMKAQKMEAKISQLLYSSA